MTKPQKKIVKIKLDSIRFDIEGDILEAIKRLQGYYEQYKEEYTNIRLDIDTVEEYYNHSHTEVLLYGDRLETDEEYNKRIKEEQKYTSDIKQKELKELERLKKKYEGE